MLKDSDYRRLHNVKCSFHEGVVILKGSVPSFYLKQVAQVLVSKVPGIEIIDNRLKVDEDCSQSTVR